MTQVSIDNTPVSVQLSPGETTTVPAGETWKVTVFIGETNNSNTPTIEMNGSIIFEGTDTGFAFDTVLVAGDSITADSTGFDGTVVLGGYKV